jgi:NADPH2:quinone reductase
MVVQMARLTGARVITTAGSEEKAGLCRAHGADVVILYREEDLASKLAEVAPDGVSLWWETLREPDFDLVVGALARRGRMVLMAGRTARPPFPVGPFYVRDCSLHGFAMFNATADEQATCGSDINKWLVNGQLRPPIDRILSLEQSAEAHRLQESSTVGATGELKGKIVVRP